MEKKFLVLFAVCFLALQFVSAVDTDIKIVTYPNHDIRLEFINPNAVAEKESSLIDLQRLNSGDSGEISYTFSTSKDVFNVNYALSVEGEKILSGKVKDVTSGETLKMVLLKGAEEIIKNYEEPVVEEVEEENVSEENMTAEVLSDESEEAEAETEESEEGSESFFSKISPVKLWSVLKFSGLAADEENSDNNHYLYYGGAVFFLLVLIFAFMVVRHRRQKMHVDNSSSNSGSESKPAENSSFENSGYDKDFLDRRIDEAKDE